MKGANFVSRKVVRMKGALARLKNAFTSFKETKQNKLPWVSSRNCKKHQHSGSNFETEYKRMQQEMSKLKERINNITSCILLNKLKKFALLK